ncbi:MAG: SMP-30/gluconolactonase/LRE family protein [Acidobacteriia bacterium]|nr:SMP-30/gluconolactonase/LRE family protein [Terriglobia bacterium]
MSTTDFLTVADPAFHRIVPASACIEKLATGFAFTEGPIWTRDGDLAFSDIPNNSIFRWNPDTGAVSLLRKPSGYDGHDAPLGAFIGSNGLTLDAVGRLVICEHGNGRVTRLEQDGSLTVLASRFEGKRLNSPNDLVYHSSGDLYFTDPPYGFVKQDQDPRKELSFNGIFRLRHGALDLLYADLMRPNGLLFTPGEKTFFVANSDPARKIWMRFDVTTEGTLSNGSVFADVTGETAGGLPDGMKLDQEGTLYCTGPGGIWVFLPDRKLLGKIHFPEIPANLHWGDADAQTLYVTARTSLYRIRLNIPGIRP